MSAVCKTWEGWRHDLFVLLLLSQQDPGPYSQHNTCSCAVVEFEAALRIVSTSNLRVLLHVPCPGGRCSRSQECNAMWLRGE